MTRSRLLIQSAWLLCLGTFASGVRAAPVDFAREILPILSNKCFVCHGPDGTDETELRLDSAEAATADLGGYRAVNQEEPESSELLVRIHSADDPMPPRESGKQLTERERDLLDRWARGGGQYAQHWSFVPPQKKTPTGPTPSTKPAVIDAFVKARLHENGFEFARPASRPELARRAALVLTGLPPEPDQLARFMRSTRPDAYEQLVDELLESPRFGEHQARYWLDAVRYGDTHGLHLDNRRGIYPYRDWVVRAFNSNLPLDEFLTWQIAGDLLTEPTLDQRVATGFVRMNPTTGEGGALPLEFQAKNNFDRTETLGTVLLGMSLTCARCHTHKFDPITQQEYYRLLAFFNSTAENSMDGNAYAYGPSVGAPRDQAGWDAWTRAESSCEQLLAAVAGAWSTEPPQWEQVKMPAPWSTSDWQLSKPYPTAKRPPAGAEWNSIDGLSDLNSVRMPPPEQSLWLAFQIQNSAPQTLWLTTRGGPESTIEVDGVELQEVFPTSSPFPTVRFRLELAAQEYEVRVRVAGAAGRAELSTRLESPWELLSVNGSWSDCDKRSQLLMLADRYGPISESWKTEANTVLAHLLTAEAEFTSTLVASDLAEPRATHVLTRGEYNRPTGDPLVPGVPSVMGAFPASAPRNRLGLARWLTSREHPLVARVLVNRSWQRVFGYGLVRTPEDFGRQGEQPTHPELLDWLAVEIHDSGWDQKHLFRLLVTSRTFRQSSARRADVDDPENRLLARGPRYRLDAEVLRDLGLWASGLLDPKMGGEGVKPYQPDGMWIALAHPASNTKQYVRDSGQRLYRKSLYIYWKRTSPHPMMTLFDAPDREASCVQRSRTNTSLQSLGLLNETQRIEMGRALAERLLESESDDIQRLELLFRLLACRSPTDSERSACLSLLATMRTRYTDAPRDAESLLATGEARRKSSLSVSEVASWTQLSVTVLASDVAIMLY